MSITLSELVERLQGDVPAEDGVPSDEQFENAIKEAVRDFSEQCGLEQISTLSIVSGTATYDLPADFLKLILLESFDNPSGVIHSSGGLVPISVNWTERHTIRNGQITFFPIPAYSMTREINYKAAWILTGEDPDYGGGEYETLGEREARIVLLKAKSIATEKVYKSQASSGVNKYSLGAVSVDKGDSITTLEKNISSFQTQYEAACAKYNGQVGIF